MRLKIVLLSILIALLATLPALAQDTPPIDPDVDTSGITDDQVNAIANQLYCPVCENIPLDTCGTLACEDWRQEIRAMLAGGMSEEAIIDNFVRRFGDRVVSSPRDPFISAMSIITPWLVALFAAGFAIVHVMKWNQSRSETPVADSGKDKNSTENNRNSYMEQLEKDLAGK